ncbi:MFS transporter [Endozoicomonas sp. G2_1]|uniref:MFS transporter n=1 Tax=Endozoicomonas sp. G2_1 TaxID=2821091 RepID=UPI001ADD601C|nr:MFS transporter [Endozoicomonas sp. G2_1]MBO9489737.1 MFS transporter [Endozoicomonas sp. G2_1]
MNVQLSFKEKVGFSLGDMAGNFVYTSVVFLLSYFYTDIFGLDAATVTAIFLVVRIFDAVTDPLMGAIVDRNESRWGKYRPFLLFLCVPYAISSVLVFTVPDLSADGKTIYAYATYALLMLLFTATNIPYFSLGSVMTADPKERVSLNSYRFVAATAGGLIVTTCVLPLADLLGGDNKAEGYRQAMMVMAALSVVLFLICFASTTERVKPVVTGKKNVKQDFLQVFANDQWRLLGLAVLILVTSQTIKGTMAAYYINYYVEDGGTTLAVFLSVWMVGGIIGSALANPLTKRMCKRNAWVMLCFISALLSAATYLIGSQFIIAILVMQFFVGLFNQMMAPLIFSTMADVTDYGELKNNRRLDGLISSFTIFSLKVGLAIGGAFATYMLTVYGYQSGGVDQSQETVSGILTVFTLLPAVGFIITGIVIYRMKLTGVVVEQQAQELVELRAAS